MTNNYEVMSHAHATTALLSWHMENHDMLGYLDQQIEKKSLANFSEHELRGSLWNRSFIFVSAVVTSEHTTCSGHTGALLPAPSGYIASSVSETSRQGTSLCPWHIQVQPGQKINLTLHDFGVWIRQGKWRRKDMGKNSWYYWPFVSGIYRWILHTKRQWQLWRFYLLPVGANCWTNNWVACHSGRRNARLTSL